jgi:DNA-binding response OmpR family regulator
VIVLLLGRHQELSAYRIEALEAAGFHVLSPISKQDAVQAITDGHYDVALLSYSLTNEQAQEFAELIRQNCPQCPLVVISETGWDDSKIQPDETVVGREGPQGLIEAIHRAMAKRIRRIK